MLGGKKNVEEKNMAMNHHVDETQPLWEKVDWRLSVVSQTASFVFSVLYATLVTISKQGTCFDDAEVADRKWLIHLKY